MEIILGIDPGSRVTGYGLIKANSYEHSYIAGGVITIEGHDLAHRMIQVYEGLLNIVKQYQPSQAAIEQVFMHRNAGSALKLGQARGAGIVAVAAEGLTVAEYSPRQIKQAVVGYGAADKLQIQQMVKRLLKLPQLPLPDEADALAVAICHANSQGVVVTRSSYLRRGKQSHGMPCDQEELIISAE